MFLNYTDKACVMKIARLKAPVICDNQGLLFSPDVSAKPLKQRKIFDPVKKKMALLSIPELWYGVVHPSTLLVAYKKKRYTFENATEAETFVWGLKDCNQEAMGK